MDLIRELARRLNFDYEIIEEKEWGTYNVKTRKWNGAVRRLIDREADIGLFLFVTTEREAEIDFTVPYYDLAGISILLKPNPTSHMVHFINVLKKEVWLLIIVMLVLTRYVSVNMVLRDGME